MRKPCDFEPRREPLSWGNQINGLVLAFNGYFRHSTEAALDARFRQLFWEMAER